MTSLRSVLWLCARYELVLAVRSRWLQTFAVVFAGLALAVAGAGYILATELADYLTGKGVPFREAHAITGRLVRWCLEHKKDLRDLTLADIRGISTKFEKDALDVLTVEGAIERRSQIGGTARKRVEARLKALEKVLA